MASEAFLRIFLSSLSYSTNTTLTLVSFQINSDMLIESIFLSLKWFKKQAFNRLWIWYFFESFLPFYAIGGMWKCITFGWLLFSKRRLQFKMSFNRLVFKTNISFDRQMNSFYCTFSVNDLQLHLIMCFWTRTFCLHSPLF
jgi:hypothetical protein